MPELASTVIFDAPKTELVSHSKKAVWSPEVANCISFTSSPLIFKAPLVVIRTETVFAFSSLEKTVIGTLNRSFVATSLGAVAKIIKSFFTGIVFSP